MTYPRLHLNSKKPKCVDEQNCKQCYDNTGALGLCVTARRDLADKVYNVSQERQCTTDSLCMVTSQLLTNDNLLIKHSNDYKLHANWFAKVYSFLKWQQEAANALLHNLVELNANQMEQDVFLEKFDSLTILHSYIDQLIEYLVLYYCCFDSKLWIAVFYPFIEAVLAQNIVKCYLLKQMLVFIPNR